MYGVPVSPREDPTLVAGGAPPPQPALGADLEPGGQLPAGLVLGDYRVERLLGQGGCGAVYAARRLDGKGLAAIKVMHPYMSASPKAVERFVREVSLVRLVHHPGIVEIFDLGQLDDGRPYYVMEHLEGEPLSVLLRRRGRIPLAEAIELLEPVCAALAAAHDAGIVHRDVKASNIIVTGDGASTTARLIDFGIAKLTQAEESSGFTTVGRHVGTLSAMAPEQILGGPIDARADVYALGLLLYKLLTGHHPFWSPAEDEIELAWRHIETPPPRPSERAPVPPAVDAVVLRALEKAPDRRFDSARAFFAALCEAAGGRAPAFDGVRDGLAIGVHVEIAIDHAGDDYDASLLHDLGRALDLAEDALRARGYLVVLAAGTSLVAARPLAGPEEQRDAEAETRALADALAARPDADPRVRPRLRRHIDRALLRLSGAPELLGGPLTDLHTWPDPAD